MLALKPDMASLSVGSNNFPTRVYENPPDLVDWLAAEMKAYGITPEIEAFDLSHILQAIARHRAGGPRWQRRRQGCRRRWWRLVVGEPRRQRRRRLGHDFPLR